MLWKIPTALPGYNSPVIWGKKVLLSGANKDAQAIYCYDLETGKLVWEHAVADIPRPAGKISKPTDDTGYAAPTVATDGSYVYAIFATGDIVCTDMNGTRIWAKNMGIPDNHLIVASVARIGVLNIEGGGSGTSHVTTVFFPLVCIICPSNCSCDGYIIVW